MTVERARALHVARELVSAALMTWILVACGGKVSYVEQAGGAGAGSSYAGFGGSGTGPVGFSGSAGYLGPGGFAGGFAGEIMLAADGSGAVYDPGLHIQGSWYAYSDGWGPQGLPPGDCQNAGHSDSECAQVTLPVPPFFANQTEGMHTTGTVEQVVNVVGMTGCPSENCDYGHQWGAGIGVSLNDGGSRGSEHPYDATSHGVTGVAFDFYGNPPSGLRVEFPTPSTIGSAAAYLPGSAATNYVSPLVEGHNRIVFATDIHQPDYISTPVPFDPTQLLSIQFHVPTSTAAPAAYDFGVSNFALIVP